MHLYCTLYFYRTKENLAYKVICLDNYLLKYKKQCNVSNGFKMAVSEAQREQNLDPKESQANGWGSHEEPPEQKSYSNHSRAGVTQNVPESLQPMAWKLLRH